MKHGKKKRGGNVKPLVMRIAFARTAERISCELLSVTIMAKASRAYSGSRQSIGSPTLSKNNYMQLFRTIRKAREESASIKTARTEVQPIAKDP